MVRLDGPRAVHGVRNLRCVLPGVLACGEYPRDAASWQTLRNAGVDAVLALRQREEPAKSEWPAYTLQEERAACAAVGLAVYHVPAEDYDAPPPATVRAALEQIDTLVGAGHSVYVHCMAGVGRTGVIVAAWLLTRGVNGDDAMRFFLDGVHDRFDRLLPQVRAAQHPARPLESWPAFVARVRPDLQLWTLAAIARTLNRPVTVVDPLLPPRQPPGSATWEAELWEALRPWRERGTDRS